MLNIRGAMLAFTAGSILAASAALAQPSLLAGRYAGTWTNTTFATTGAARFDLFVDNSGASNVYKVRFSADGSVFGGSAAEPTYIALSRTNATTWTGSLVGDPKFGNVTATLSNTGNISITGSAVPGGVVSGFTVTGTINSSGSTNLLGTINLNAGGTASTTIALTRSDRTTLASQAPSSTGLFGTAVAGIGDVDGDGAGDIVVGALVEVSNTVTAAGNVYVISGRTGVVIRTLADPNRRLGGAFGSSVSGMPDCNGDGVNDIVVGAVGHNPGGAPSGAGRAYIFSGATGVLLGVLVPAIDAANAQFGWTVSGVADINGDGRGDVIVGAPFFSPAGGNVNTGRVTIFQGNNYAGGNATRIRNFGSPTGTARDYFGYSVAGMGDVDGDGRGDYIVGSPQAIDGDETGRAGSVILYSGLTGAIIRQINNPTAQGNSLFGASVAQCPDVTADGTADILVGSPRHARPGQPPQGRVYLFDGRSGTGIRAIFSPTPATNGNFGISVAGIRDQDADGRGDIIVGAPYEPTGGTGRVHLISGNTGLLIRSYGSTFPTTGGSFGFSVSRVLDTNANGAQDILVGANREALPIPSSPGQSGAAYLFRR